MRIKITDIFILIIAFATIISFFSDKYIYLLDSAPRTNMYLNLIYDKTVPEYGGSLFLAVFSVPAPIMTFIILFCGAHFMCNFASNIMSSKMGQFYAGILYVINPYVYIRLMTGQLFLLFPYATLPLLFKSFIDLMEKKEIGDMIKFTFLLSVVAFSIHMLIIALFIIGIIFLFWFNKHRDIRISKIIILSVILFILLNSYWILPLITAKNTVIANIGEKDFEVFAPKGSLFDIASMHGFWLEGYLYTRDFLPGWQILYLIILSLAIIGLIYYYTDEKIGIYVKAFAVIGILGFILASGVNGPFGDIVRWLFDNTILKGFRDSQKFVAMLVLAYSVLGGLGLNKIKNIYDKYN